jgi:TetR/AcrR family transcriptional regulator, fatty acid metabolism regulator protein
MNLKPERKGEIVAAALRLIEKKGIQNLTTRNLAREVGITEPGIYRHFRNKQDILLSVLAHFRKDASETLEEIIAAEGAPLQKIGALYARSLRGFSKNPAITAVIFSEEIFQNNRKLSREVFAIMEMNRNGLERILGEGKEGDEIPGDAPVSHLSLVIMGTFRLLVTRWRLSERSFDLEKEGAALWNSLNMIIINSIGAGKAKRRKFS